MSLDVYLRLPGVSRPHGSGIFVRTGGQVKEISRDEWDALHPGVEPIVLREEDASSDGYVYSQNITHNLNKMAEAAGIYQHLWRPDEIGIAFAAELIEPLTVGLRLLQAEPERFKALNPENGWGDYEGFVQFVEDYIRACAKYPQAAVSVSR